jgi:hypothetical protein
MIINLLVGLLFILIGINNFYIILGFLFIIAPYIAYYISKPEKPKTNLKRKDIDELKDIAYKTWKFFEDNINEKCNYLICDNYQEDRKEKIVLRTSSTNIGLELISIISAYDLGFIDFEKTKSYLKNVLSTVKKLAKWNGHLYNWYRIDSLEPLKPRYVSTVDSGNFVRISFYCKRILKRKYV